MYAARDKGYLEAWELWLAGKLVQGYEKLQSVVDLHPGDLFAVKRAQLLAFCMGDLGRQLVVVQRKDVAAACRDRPFYHGMLGFALEQNGYLTEAEEAGR